jgi:hypothetical protein
MSESTRVQLDTDIYDRLVPWLEAIDYCNAHNIAKAGKGTWEARSKMDGFPMHRPNGPKGSRYAVPAEIDRFLRSRCTAQTPGQQA